MWLMMPRQPARQRKAAAAEATAAQILIAERDVLDDVDLSRQVRGNLEADFLLTNGGLGPGLHDDILQLTALMSPVSCPCHFV